MLGKKVRRIVSSILKTSYFGLRGDSSYSALPACPKKKGAIFLVLSFNKEISKATGKGGTTVRSFIWAGGRACVGYQVVLT